MVAPIALGIPTIAQVRTHLAMNIATERYSQAGTRGETACLMKHASYLKWGSRPPVFVRLLVKSLERTREENHVQGVRTP